MSAISPFRTYNAHTGGRLQYVKFGTFSASAARISAEYIDRKTWRIYNLDKKTWQRGTLWKKKISWRSAAEKTKTETWQRQKCPRKPAALPAGADTCCFVSVLFVWAANTMLFSPWIIYFSILGTHYLVRFVKAKRKTDLTITVLYFAMFILCFVFFVLRLIEAKG